MEKSEFLMTRLRLMQRYLDSVRGAFPEDSALAELKAEATNLGIYGKREPIRPCVAIN